jgi:hypothetical protein
VAGLVTITPGAGYVDITGAFFFGLLGGPVCYFAAQLKHWSADFIWKKLNLNHSGNEVYCTACSSPVILKHSCGQLHRQKVFD